MKKVKPLCLRTQYYRNEELRHVWLDNDDKCISPAQGENRVKPIRLPLRYRHASCARDQPGYQFTKTSLLKNTNLQQPRCRAAEETVRVHLTRMKGVSTDHQPCLIPRMKSCRSSEGSTRAIRHTLEAEQRAH